MATFSPAFLDELRERLMLSSIVGARVRLLRAGREFKGCCPFHKEKTPSFYVNDDKKFFHCFGCGAHGDAIGFVMRHDGQSFPEAVETLAAQAGLAVPKDTPVERERFDREKSLLRLLERATVFFEDQLRQPEGREARAYLLSRGLSDEAQRRFRLGYAGADSQLLSRTLEAEGFASADMLAVGLIKKAEGREGTYSFFRNRVMFPVGDRRGQTVAFGGRVMGEGEPKYLNSPDHPLFHKGKVLYGLSRARAAVQQGQPLIVVEGYMDVIALVEAGYSGAMAPLGTALTEEQLALLWRLLPPLEARAPERDYSPILCFDGDTAGQRAAARGVERALPLLTPAQTVRIAYLPEGEDPDSLLRSAGRGAMQAVLDQAKPLVDVVWDMTLVNRRLQTPEDRAAVARAARQRVEGIRDESLRALYRDAIDKRLASLFDWGRASGHAQGGAAPYGAMSSRAGHSAGRALGRARPRAAAPAFAAPPPVAAPRKPEARAIQKRREKVLLALMVNYPALFETFGDDLAGMRFASPPLEALRQKIVMIFMEEPSSPLDAAALYRHLSLGDVQGGASAQLADVLSEATYLHAGFARPSRSLDQARQGWKSIWNNYLQEQLQADLQAANRLWREDPSDANTARLMSLRSQMEALARESDEQMSMTDTLDALS